MLNELRNDTVVMTVNKAIALLFIVLVGGCVLVGKLVSAQVIVG